MGKRVFFRPMFSKTTATMKKLGLFLLFSLTLLLATEASAQKIKNVDNSQNAGKVEWITRQADTGKIPQGTPVTRELTFKNISSENLLILRVNSTCYCTVAEWPQNPIEPGKTGVIKLTYDAESEGPFYKVVFVMTNFDSVQGVAMAMIGTVEKKPEAATTKND
jgi:hypothetical protein